MHLSNGATPAIPKVVDTSIFRRRSIPYSSLNLQPFATSPATCSIAYYKGERCFPSEVINITLVT